MGERLRQTNALVGFNQANRDRWVAGVAERLPARTRVLDVGAGTCPYRALFSHCDYRTHDFCAYDGTTDGLLRDEWAYGEIDYVSDVSSIPVPDGSFDAVLCTEVLEHVPDPVAALRELGRITAPGGRLFLSAPLGSGLHQEPHHYYGGFTPHFYRRFLPESGFEIETIAANGGFFRHLLQEVNRAADVIELRSAYGRRHPVRFGVRLVARVLAPAWLSRLDDRVPVEEFTVGYHVEAVKLS